MTFFWVLLSILVYVRVVHIEKVKGDWMHVSPSYRWRSRARWEAERARERKWESYYLEYLGYGYSKEKARASADSKMDKDAKAASEVLKDAP